MERRTKTFGLLLLFLMMLSLPVKSEYDPVLAGYHERESCLYLDYAGFLVTDSNCARLEVYYRFCNAVLQFKPSGGSFEAAYKAVIRIRDKNDRQIDSYSRERKITVANEQRAHSVSDFRINLVSFNLVPGKYKLEFSLRDKVAEKTVRREEKLKLGDCDREKPHLSDIVFIMDAGNSQETPSVFDKGNLTLVPSVMRSYGASDNKRLGYYLEIYQGSDLADDVFVEATVRKKWGNMVYRDSMTILLEESTVRQYREVSLDQMAPGDYELEVRLRGRRGKKLDQKRRNFRVEWTPEALVRHNYKDALRLLSYIANHEEIEKLEKCESHRERLESIREFWLSRDPTSGTRENELRDEFYRRVQYANRNFSFMSQNGWRSDRGKTYIKLGEPDQIDDYPVSVNRRPYQVWYYYQSDGYRKYTFVDENEDGDYRLVYPYNGFDQRPDF
ncbi:MAG: GWxTD domain-containing protein [candidate division Zixibacteria bacterium]|nr:GWxTD domain-containing protein [candidate division Zixibacteria bacterium]